MGVHHALNYKDKDFAKQLRKTGHVDVYFDNGAYDYPCSSRMRVALQSDQACVCG